MSTDQDIHFLKIDVEGFERQVMKRMDFRVYSFACQYGINRFYVSKQHSKLQYYFSEINAEILDRDYSIAVHDQSQKLQELHNEINSLKNSRSWKYTEPFRRIVYWTKKK